MPALMLAVVAVGFQTPRKRPLAVSALCVAAVLSLPTAWPARVTVALSRSGLEAAAAEVAAGHTIQGPQRVGLLIVQRSRYRGGVVFLGTAPNPSGWGGFAACRADEVGRRFNLWSSYAVSEDWQLVFED